MLPFKPPHDDNGLDIEGALPLIRYQVKIGIIELVKISTLYMIMDFVNRKNLVTVVHSLIVSKVDYCNSLFIGLPNVILRKVQSVLNRAARLIFNLPSRVPTTTSLIELHWLPLKARIEFKICLTAFKALKFNQPSHIRELLSFSSHESTLGLQSADDPYRLHEPRNIEERGFANRFFFLHCPAFI